MEVNELEVKKHVHSYRRVRDKIRKDLWMCADPECPTRTTSKWLLGKKAKCFYCGEDFIITSKKLNKQGFLHCDNCKRGGTGKKLEGEKPTLEAIEKLLKGEL